MRKNWLSTIAALALGYFAGPAGAQEPVDLEPSEPVYTIVPRHTFDDPDPLPKVRPYQITLAGGIYLFQPTFQSDPALVVTHAGGGTQQLDFHRNMIASPTAWLGITTDRGWGVRARWYTFDQNATLIQAAGAGDTLTPASPVKAVLTPVFATASATSELHLDSWDFEGTCTLQRAHWLLLLGGGLRYVHLDQTYSAVLTDAAGGLTTAGANHNFNGVGPTFSLQGKRPFGHTCFATYGNVHGSVLFGSASDTYTGLAPTGASGSFSRHTIDVLPIGELEVGVEYNKPVQHTCVFVQAGFVGQVFWGGGSPSNFDSVNSSASANSNFGLVGLAVRAGITF